MYRKALQYVRQSVLLPGSRFLCTCTGKMSGLNAIAQQIKVAGLVVSCKNKIYFPIILQFSGPITVAEYMKQCLLHPVFVST